MVYPTAVAQSLGRSPDRMGPMYDRQLLIDSLRKHASIGASFEYSIGYELMGQSRENAIEYWTKTLSAELEPFGFTVALTDEGTARDLYDRGVLSALDTKFADRRVLVFSCLSEDDGQH